MLCQVFVSRQTLGCVLICCCSRCPQQFKLQLPLFSGDSSPHYTLSILHKEIMFEKTQITVREREFATVKVILSDSGHLRE